MISLVTTYKDRPNYTTITLATMREALHRFDEKVNFFFYDDASVKPMPSIVTEFCGEDKIEGSCCHRNNKSLGAEWGNIDAITKCFERFPKTTHVLVLDNDLCVHPDALVSIRKMIVDIPNLGFGSIFNSNVFPEGRRIGSGYVEKPVNPGLGGVIARDAWFWHLDKSKGTKLDKDPKHPGWDWNLSAWLKSTCGKWEVCATYQSFVEHIGCSGTNVTEATMTRARRYQDKILEVTTTVNTRIDILMPVKDMDGEALGRMAWCIRSLRGNGEQNFRLCISDTSTVSMREQLCDVIDMPFEYTYEKCTGLFNRSRTINNGVRNLVKSSSFIVMDTDIIVPNNFLVKFLDSHKRFGNYTVGRLAYLNDGHPFTEDWSKLYGHSVGFYYNSGFFVCDLDIFKQVNGFDENYVGWGGEDDQLNVRIGVLTQGKMRKLEGMEMTCWHLYHPRKDSLHPEATAKNRKLYWEQKILFENGTLRVNAVKGLEDRSEK
jgi:hypothetical protein